MPGCKNLCAAMLFSILSIQAACADDTLVEQTWSKQLNSGMLFVAQMQATKAESEYLAALKTAEGLDSFHKALALRILGDYYLVQNRQNDAEKCFSQMLELSKQCDAADAAGLKNLAYDGFVRLHQAMKEQVKCAEAKGSSDTAKAQMLNGIPKWQTYLQNTSTIVNKSWKDRKSRSSVFNPRPVWVGCRIHKDGNIDCLMLWKSSGAFELDQDALNAVRVLSPLPPMEPGATNNLIAAYLFDSNPMDHNQVEMSEKELLHELEKTAVKGHTQRISALLTLAMLERTKNNRPCAEGYLSRALVLAQEEPTDPSLLMQVNLALAEYQRQYSEFVKATEYAQKALDCAKDTKNSELYSNCLELKANMLMKSGKTEDSLKCFAELADLKKKNNR